MVTGDGRRARWCALAVCAVAAACSEPEPAPAIDAGPAGERVPAPGEVGAIPVRPERRVVFIGNSYTAVNDLPEVVEQLAASEQSPVTLHVSNHTRGGASWYSHDLDEDTTEVISWGWDYVVLQDQSSRPWASTGIDPALLSLDAKVAAAGARSILFMTWARTPLILESTYVKMNLAVNNYYERHGAAIGARVAPVGRAWERALRDPDMVLHDDDGSHPNERGTYLAACVFYTMLTGHSPVGLGDGGLSTVTAEERAVLQQVAWDTIRDRRRLAEPAVGVWPMSAGGASGDLLSSRSIALGDTAGPDGAPGGATRFGAPVTEVDYAAIPYVPGLNAEHFTLAFHALRDDWTAPTAAVQTLFAKSWGYSITQDGSSLDARLYTVESDQPIVLQHSLGALAPGWHAFALTYDGAAFTLWIDAQVAATAGATGGVRYYQADPSEDLRFNSIQIGGAFSDLFEGPLDDPDTTFTGSLAGVRLYDRALDAAELQAL